MAATSVPRAALPLSAADRRRVEVHLETLLESEAFSSSKRCREFLRYIVAETLGGRGAGIKERTIATDVFGKGPDFDSQTESIVRVKANDVRKRLAQSYTSGVADDVRIVLPVGAYQPEFQFVEHAPLAMPSAPRQRRSFPRWLLPGLIGAACAALALLAITNWPRPTRLFDPLWTPFAEQDRPVLISLPAPTVFELQHKEKWLPLHERELIPASDLRERNYVGVGAAYGAARFGEQLARRGRTFYLKFGQDVTFSDLRQGPAILLGAMTSQWTLDITQRLRFRFEVIPDNNRIVEASTPSRYWQPVPAGPGHPNAESYALVTRLLASESGHPLLMASGLSAHDTQAAVEFLTSAECFEQFTRQAPDWKQKNFQVVLRAFVHGHSPGSPTVVTSYLW